jgi:hypothetical protein
MVLRKWIRIKAENGPPLTGRQVAELLADLRACTRDLAEIPDGAEHDAQAVRCSQLADAYQEAFKALAYPAHP